MRKGRFVFSAMYAYNDQEGILIRVQVPTRAAVHPVDAKFMERVRIGRRLDRVLDEAADFDYIIYAFVQAPYPQRLSRRWSWPTFVFFLTIPD